MAKKNNALVVPPPLSTQPMNPTGGLPELIACLAYGYYIVREVNKVNTAQRALFTANLRQKQMSAPALTSLRQTVMETSQGWFLLSTQGRGPAVAVLREATVETYSQAYRNYTVKRGVRYGLRTELKHPAKNAVAAHKGLCIATGFRPPSI